MTNEEEEMDRPLIVEECVDPMGTCYLLRVQGGDHVAWDCRPWVPGKAIARFLSAEDAMLFADAHGQPSINPARRAS